MQRSCAVAGTAAVAVAKIAAAIRAVRVFVIGVSLERRLDFRTGQVWSFTAAVHRARRSRRLPGHGAALPRDLSPWGMYLNADPVVKAVLMGLAFASIV